MGLENNVQTSGDSDKQRVIFVSSVNQFLRHFLIFLPVVGLRPKSVKGFFLEEQLLAITVGFYMD